jgi:hypothetical protein
MTTYYIKKYGVHELHEANCVWLPIRKGMVKLGDYVSAEDALEVAVNRFQEVNPCRSCCKFSQKKNISAARK